MGKDGGDTTKIKAFLEGEGREIYSSGKGDAKTRYLSS